MRYRLNYTRNPKPIHGFTLIELLVVIAVIALLLAILMPALNKAKEMAAEIPCMANQRSIALAFHLYQVENNGHLVTGNAWFIPSDASWAGARASRSWVFGPMDESGTEQRDNYSIEYEIIGIKAGRLWPYIEDENAYHCPADKRTTREGVGFRSYSMVAGIGANYRGYVTEKQEIHKMGQIRNPSGKYITVEESEKKADGSYWWNVGSWVIDLQNEYWYDPVASWHGNGCTLGFADGHAEKIKWRDQRTIQWIQGNAAKGSPGIQHRNPTVNPDMKYMLSHFPHN